MKDYAVITTTELEACGGTEAVVGVADGFSCLRNPEVDAFLRTDGLEFTRRKISITHLVFDALNHRLLGYFTLTHKPLSMPVATLNKTQLRRISRFARPDADGKAYTLSAFLIAQIGKNMNVESGRLISGAKLLEIAKDSLKIAQERIGGQVVFLEMEKGNAKLSKFYAENGFFKFGERKTVEDGRPITYDQLFLFLK